MVIFQGMMRLMLVAVGSTVSGSDVQVKLVNERETAVVLAPPKSPATCHGVKPGAVISDLTVSFMSTLNNRAQP